MKKVIFCETPFQVIVAIYIREQFSKKNDQVDIVLADTFSGYRNVAERLEKKKIFRKVYTIKVKDIIYSKTLYQYFCKLFYIFFPKKFIKQRLNKNIDKYDEMYCGNYDLFTASVRTYFELNHHSIKVFLFDEGYISYFPMDEINPVHRFLKILEIRNKLFGLSHITRKNIDGLLLFEPENLLYKPNCPVYQINRHIENQKEFKELINYIFQVDKVIQQYDKKYIIFEEAILANHTEIDDEKIFDKIINIVGKENVIIKLHPRTEKDRFSSKGIKTLGNEGVPWEAIACVGDFKDKVFITISSSSITTYKMLFGNKMKAYMLFKFLKPNLKHFDNKYNQFWNKMGNITKEGGIYMPSTEDEFYSMIKKDK